MKSAGADFIQSPSGAFHGDRRDDLAKSRGTPYFVIPAKAGIQEIQGFVDLGFRVTNRNTLLP